MSIDFDNYKNGGALKDRYIKMEDISEGAYGIVSLAHDTHKDGKLVAVKYITQFTDDSKDKSGSRKSRRSVQDRTTVLLELQQEISILTKLGSHPNIAQLYDSFDSYLILEYCSRGDLYEIIRSNCGPTSTKDIVDVMTQLIAAVSYAHRLGIYHRDIKPENILVTEDWSIKLTDWGLATDKNICTDFDVGSDRYMAPELFDRKNIESYEASKCDVWSLGICLLNIVFGKNPFTVANQSEKLFVHFAANRETLFDIFPSMSYELFGVLRYSLTIDPDNRDLENMRQELAKVRHITLDYDLEAMASETETKTVLETEERSKSNPVVTNSPEKKFVHRNRKPLAIPSKRYGDQSYKNRNQINNSFSYNRQDFFTPRSVFNKYMDKINKNHEQRDLDGTHRNGNHKNVYYKRKTPNKKAWRKSYKKPPVPRNIGNDGGFLKPLSIKRTSPPSSLDIKLRRKRYSDHSYSSSAGKYVPPSLRSPTLEPQQLKKPDESIYSNLFLDDDDNFNDNDDDDDLFMLEEYRNSPKVGDHGRNTDLSFNYPNAKSMRGTSTKLQSVTNLTPQIKLDAPIPLSSSGHSHGDKYVPPHQRRNSHSAVMNQKRKIPQRSNRFSQLVSNSDFETASSMPNSWSLKNEKLSKVNRKFDKNYTQDEFRVNDMYHTFAKLRLQNEDNNKAPANVFSSDEENDSEYTSLKNGPFKFATRAIPSYTG